MTDWKLWPAWTFCRLCDLEIQQMKNNGAPPLDALQSFLHHFIATAKILQDDSIVRKRCNHGRIGDSVCLVAIWFNWLENFLKQPKQQWW